MSTKAEQAAKLLNDINVKTRQQRLGDFVVEQATRQGEAVADAAGAAPTAEEFKALLDSLRASGLIATA